MTGKLFIYEAPYGGALFVQEGGFVNVGLDAKTGRQVTGRVLPISFDETIDVLALALEELGETLPPFRLTLELLEASRQ